MSDPNSLVKWDRIIRASREQVDAEVLSYGPVEEIDSPFDLGDEDLSFVGTCQRCGRYLDVRQHKRCPSPCDGYIG